MPRLALLARSALAILLVTEMSIGPSANAVDQAAAVTITADYDSSAGTFDHAKYLNANEGGYLTHNALEWLPESYPQFDQAGLRMVAITHLLNENFYSVVSGTPPNLSYDFSRLDRVVLPLVQQGMTPLMGVAFTPESLGGADKATGFSNAIPNNNAVWQQVVQAMVQHYVDLGHTGWYWEVWNEPDLGGFWAGTQAQYNAMYQATAAGVKAADPAAKIGGPATAQGGWAFFGGFTEFLGANPNVPLDFASFHTYGPDPTFGLVDQAKSRLGAAGRTNVPIFVTEWNITFVLNGGAGAPPDTNQAASYAVRRIADAMSRPALSKIFWFSPKEGLQPTNLFNGDLGLVTVDGHRKAAFNAFQLVNRLQTTLLTTSASGSGTTDGTVGAIATKDPASGKITVLAWNDQSAGTDLDLQLTSLPYADQQVQLTKYLIDATHGNYYKDYADGLRGWSVGPTENADPVESRIIPGASQFDETVIMSPHSVVAYVLEPTQAPATDVSQSGPEPLAVGTRNLAHGQPVNTSSAVPWGWSPQAMVDGITHTFVKVDSGPATNGWSSTGHPAAEATEWAYVDLGSPVGLSRVKLFPRDDRDCEGYGFPIDFTIQGSDDGINWSTLLTKINYNDGDPIAAPARGQTFEVSGTYRYVRVHATRLQAACAGDPSRHFQLAELQVESDVNLAARAKLRASGNGVSVRLPAAIMVSRVDLVAADAGKDFPDSFQIQAADGDCTDWRTVVSRTDYPNPGKFRHTFGFASQTISCIRVVSMDGQSLRLADGRVYH